MVDSDSTEVLGRRYVAFLVDGALAVAAGVVAAWTRAERFPVSGRSTAEEQRLADLAEFEILGFREVLGVPVARAQEIGDTLWVFAGDSWRAGLIAALLVAIVLFTIIPALTGRTLGMIPLGLRITDDAGERPGVAAHLVRSLVGVIDLVPIVVPGALGFVLARSDRFHRRIGDQVAGTVVVDAAASARPARRDLLEGAVVTAPAPSSAAERRPPATETEQVRPAAETIEPTKKRRLGWRGQEEDTSEMIDLSARLDATPPTLDLGDSTDDATSAAPATDAPPEPATSADAPQSAGAAQPLPDRWNVATGGQIPPPPVNQEPPFLVGTPPPPETQPPETQPREALASEAQPLETQPSETPSAAMTDPLVTMPSTDLPPPPSHRARTSAAEPAVAPAATEPEAEPATPEPATGPAPTSESATAPVEEAAVPTSPFDPSSERSWEPPIAETAPVWTPTSFEPESPSEADRPTELETAPTPTPSADADPVADQVTPDSTPTPTPAPEPEPEPAAAAAPGAGSSEPIWSEKWQAWLYWEPAAQQWLRHDANENEWIPIT